jgi:type III restriction enzyme
MAKRRFQIDHLIINSPFDEPTQYWKYIRDIKMFEMVEGSRRPAGYLISSPNARAHDDPGVFMPLALANDLRPRVRVWREAGYAGITGVTRRLLEHWYDKTERDNRFFFCQLEAIETLVWLHEAPAAERQGIDVPTDGGPFRRLCSKMATGTGKTVVMAMLAAWQILNKVTYPNLSWCSKNILVIAPGLTVKNRLQVLYADSEGNYYDEFSIVPGGMIDALRQGRIRVLNWHKLDWESDAQIAKKRSVDKRGAKSDEAYVRDVLGEMSSERDWVVVNDEAHHAWRATADLTGIDKSEIEEAKKWVQGLDRIHRARHCRCI